MFSTVVRNMKYVMVCFMRSSILFYIAFSCLLGLGSWGLLRIADVSLLSESTYTQAFEKIKILIATKESLEHLSTDKKQSESLNNNQLNSELPNVEQDGINSKINVIAFYLKNDDYTSAGNLVNEHYSDFSSVNLETIQSLYRQHAFSLKRQGNAKQALSLLKATSKLFNDLQSWSDLSSQAIELKQWPLAFDATLNASMLQNDSLKLDDLQRKLVILAAHYRSTLEQQARTVDIHHVYDRLYKAHPSYPRYQLELALSHIERQQYNEARLLLTPLQYDTELGEVSRTALSKLSVLDTDSLEKSALTDVAEKNGSIAHPLSDLGTNLLTKVRVNQRAVTLLLDTGASITALDSALIAQLNLTPTGDNITINTANGTRIGKLYRVNDFRLGPFILQNHIIANIDLGKNSPFSGLLGTDVLNAVGDNYSYIIDNQRKALIFTPQK